MPIHFTVPSSSIKSKSFSEIVFLFLLKTQIVGTPYKRLTEAVLTSTYNRCFGAEIRKIGIPLHTSVLLYKSG